MEAIAAFIVWVLANAVYVDMRRRGERGFKRLVAFWIGWPGTLVGMASVDEGSQPSIRHDDEGLRNLVVQIRRDRLERGEGAGDSELAVPPSTEASDVPPDDRSRGE